jgi:hypothetical protein
VKKLERFEQARETVLAAMPGMEIDELRRFADIPLDAFKMPGGYDEAVKAFLLLDLHRGKDAAVGIDAYERRVPGLEIKEVVPGIDKRRTHGLGTLLGDSRNRDREVCTGGTKADQDQSLEVAFRWYSVAQRILLDFFTTMRYSVPHRMRMAIECYVER